jgi:hypothetical protein
LTQSKAWFPGSPRRVAERGVDAALRRAGVAADRMHFRDDRDVGAAFGGFDRCAHTG